MFFCYSLQVPTGELEKLKIKMSELEKQEDEYRKKEEELKKKEKVCAEYINALSIVKNLGPYRR